MGAKFTNNPTVNKRVETITYMFTTALSLQATAALTIVTAAAANAAIANRTEDMDFVKELAKEYAEDMEDILEYNFNAEHQGSIPQTLADRCYTSPYRAPSLWYQIQALKESLESFEMSPYLIGLG